MGQYHHLIAGLPDITIEDSKQAYSVYGFRDDIYGVLSSKDREYIDLLFLKYDNMNLLRWLEDPEAKQDERGVISKEIFEALLSSVAKKRSKEEGFESEDEEGHKAAETLRKSLKKVPTYIVEFLKQYQKKIEEQNQEESERQEEKEDFTFTLEVEPGDNEKSEVVLPEIAWEDILAALYYAYAMKKGNRFISQWFEMNLNIKNILIAVTCKKHNLDKNLYIISNNDVAKALKNSGTKDFNLGDEVEYLSATLKLAEETDLVMREKRIDILKWEWLEYNTIFKIFGIESVFAYLLKVEMIERWTGLDKSMGEETFRELIMAMKRESNSTLKEFKKNNKR